MSVIYGDPAFDAAALNVATFVPAVGAMILMLMPRKQEFLLKVVGLVTSLIALGLTVFLLLRFDYAKAATPQFVTKVPWIPVIKSNYHVFLDGMALPLFVLSAVVIPLCIVYSWNHWPAPHNPKALLALMLILETGMLGTFIAEDLVLFFIFFEVVLLPMYFMIGVFGGEQRQYASIKFFLYTLFGSAFMLVAFMATYFFASRYGGVVLAAAPFDIPALSAWGYKSVALTAQMLIFAGMFMGFAIKVPMFPFHTWLPDAHTQAPTVGSVILAAVLLKLGTYGFIRIALPVLPQAARQWAPAIAVLATIGIIYGSLGCLAQKDMKRLIAFSSVAHMGFVMLGISTLTSWGINAAVFGMVAHGLITGMLFFVAGSVGERYGTRDMGRLGGMLVSAPKMGWLLGFACMASLGLPGLAGFWGEFPAILSAFNPAPGLNLTLFRTCMVVAAIGTVFAAAYLLWMFQRVSFGTPKEEFANAHLHDVHVEEWIAWVPLVVGIVLFGVVPSLIFSVTDANVQQMVQVFNPKKG